MKILILGYGNPGRGDDGLGPAFVEAVEKLCLEGVTTDSDYQLNIEYAADIADCGIVIFVDASASAKEPFEFSEIKPSGEISHTTHSMSPQSLMGLAHDILERPPKAFLLEIRGYEFDFAEGLTEKAINNMENALDFTALFINDINDIIDT